jgi:hypothetical protein
MINIVQIWFGENVVIVWVIDILFRAEWIKVVSATYSMHPCLPYNCINICLTEILSSFMKEYGKGTTRLYHSLKHHIIKDGK